MSIFTYNISIIDSTFIIIVPYILKYKLLSYCNIKAKIKFYINKHIKNINNKAIKTYKSNLSIFKKNIKMDSISLALCTVNIDNNTENIIDNIDKKINNTIDDDWGWYINL